MTDQEKQNIATVRKAYREGTDVIDQNIVWHVPGNNPVSGVYRGAMRATIEEWIVEVEEVMVNGNMAVTSVRLRGTRKHHRIDMNGAHVMRVEGGKIVEGWGFAENQDVLDEFFSA